MTRTERRADSRRMAHEAQDWLFNALGAAVVAGLVLLAVAGHAWVSAGMH